MNKNEYNYSNTMIFCQIHLEAAILNIPNAIKTNHQTVFKLFY